MTFEPNNAERLVPVRDIGSVSYPPGSVGDVGEHPLALVQDHTITDPAVLSPSISEAWLIPIGAIGAWLGHDNEIAVWNDASWDYVIPDEDGHLVFTFNGEIFYRWDGVNWAPAIPNHDDTLNISGGSPTEGRYHLTKTQHDDLTDGGDASIQHNHDGRYYTKSETNTLLDNKADINHNHNNIYYTKNELDNGQLDNRYYTEIEIDQKLNDLEYGIYDPDIKALKVNKTVIGQIT